MRVTEFLFYHIKNHSFLFPEKKEIIVSSKQRIRDFIQLIFHHR
jgi:hypothetical protein